MTEDKHECVQENIIKHNEIEIAELKQEMVFKKEKIDKLQNSMDILNDKLDTFLSRSEERDNINEKRLVALETSQSNVKTFITIGFSLLSIIIGAMGVVISCIH